MARNIEDNAIVFHHRYHPGSNQCGIDSLFSWFLMLYRILEVFLIHEVNYGSQLSFNRPKCIVCHNIQKKHDKFNTICLFLCIFTYIGSNEWAWVKLMTCLLHCDKLFAIKLPNVEIMVRSTRLESMLLSNRVVFAHLKKFFSVWSPNILAPK